ncbi:hypothetical protein L596_018979 [Steinernema carpocapsae]|uniref:Uncharacterized protein n=1 Tax=Steinernema carpocapsae TaxID=34508 RepID=A0A4U5N6T0_STECR|nr:hypothetical protein L596_018979 [Steinernema carpocapsae]
MFGKLSKTFPKVTITSRYRFPPPVTSVHFGCYQAPFQTYCQRHFSVSSFLFRRQRFGFAGAQPMASARLIPVSITPAKNHFGQSFARMPSSAAAFGRSNSFPNIRFALASSFA